MAEFIALIEPVLGLSLTIGTTTITLGAIALGTVLFGVGVGAFRKLAGKR